MEAVDKTKTASALLSIFACILLSGCETVHDMTYYYSDDPEKSTFPSDARFEREQQREEYRMTHPDG